MTKFVTLSIDRLNKVIVALNSYCNTGEIDCADDLVAELLAERDQKQNEQEPVGYEYVEHRPYGAPGEIRRGTILIEHYRNADGKIAGDWEWLVQQFKTSKNTISMRPLYTQPQPKCTPLTTGQIHDIVIAVCDKIYPQDDSSYSEADSVFYGAFVRAVDEAYGIK